MVSKNKLFLFGFIFLLILFPIVNAQPPPQTNVNINLGLEIQFPLIEFHQANQTHTFNFAVYNISDGLKLDNVSVSCSLNLYNPHGIGLINETVLTYFTESENWGIQVLEGNFTILGEYNVLVDCNDGGFGGFDAFGILITQTGFNFDTPQSLAVLGLILILLFLSGGFLFFGSKVETASVKIFLLSLGVLFFLLTLGVSLNIITELMLVGFIFSGTFVSLYRLFLILISGGMIAIVLYLITMAVTAFRKSRGILDEDGDDL